MELVKAFLLILTLLGLPVIVGSIFLGPYKRFTENPDAGIRVSLFRAAAFCLVFGQLVLMALFQAVSVPFILKYQLLPTLVKYFSLILVGVVGVAVLAFFLRLLHWRKEKKVSLHRFHNREEEAGSKKTAAVLLWLAALALFVLQLALAILLAYNDGDDSFYVATATAATASEKMYRIIPYTGAATQFSARYCMAPFPIWISFWASLFGIKDVLIAQFVLPVCFICMAYAVFGLIGAGLFEGHSEKKHCIPLFVIVMEVLILFGDYSSMTMENFFLARSRQGKAALCSLVIPALVYLILLIYKKLGDEETGKHAMAEKNCRRRVPFGMWLLLLCLNTAACLCSSLGGVLVSVFTAAAGLAGAMTYKKWKHLIPMALSCVPSLVFAYLYFSLP